MAQPLLLDAVGIAKTYAGVRALKGVSFDLRPGEVHALVGENGAGKSTLIKIITGAERPDAGTLRVAGRDVPHMDPAIAHALGIAAIYQQPALFPHLTVAENIALALERAGLWRKVDWRRRHEAASALLGRIGSADAAAMCCSYAMRARDRDYFDGSATSRPDGSVVTDNSFFPG